MAINAAGCGPWAMTYRPSSPDSSLVGALIDYGRDDSGRLAVAISGGVRQRLGVVIGWWPCQRERCSPSCWRRRVAAATASFTSRLRAALRA